MVLDLFKKKDEDDDKPKEGSRPYVVSFSRGQPQPYRPKARGAVRITGTGKVKMDTADDVGDNRYQILACLEEYGDSTIGEIADRTHIPTVKVNRLIYGKGGLVEGGFVRPAGTGGE